MRLKPAWKDDDPAAHKLNEFWGQSALPMQRFRSFPEPLNLVVRRSVQLQSSMKADPYLMEDLFASKWRDWGFILQRSCFQDCVVNKPLSNHMVSLAKIIEGLSAVVWETESKYVASFLEIKQLSLPTLKPLQQWKTMELVCAQMRWTILGSSHCFVFPLQKIMTLRTES